MRGRVATRNLKVPMKINEQNLAVKLGMPTDRIMKEVGKQLREMDGRGRFGRY